MNMRGDRDRLMAATLVLEHHEGLASDEIQSHLAAGHARVRELLLDHRMVQSQNSTATIQTEHYQKADCRA
jgi:hypothetical protein